MSRTFKTADYAVTLELQVRLGDCLPPEHRARFVVDTIGVLDLSAIHTRYGGADGQAARRQTTDAADTRAGGQGPV